MMGEELDGYFDTFYVKEEKTFLSKKSKRFCVREVFKKNSISSKFFEWHLNRS